MAVTCCATSCRAPVQKVYDTVGWFGLLALVYFGGNFLWRLISPFRDAFDCSGDETVTGLSNPQRKRVLSGMRSTGKLHLGNYVGALAELGEDAGRA